MTADGDMRIRTICVQWYQDLVTKVNSDAYAPKRVIWDVLNEPDCKVTARHLALAAGAEADPCFIWRWLMYRQRMCAGLAGAAAAQRAAPASSVTAAARQWLLRCFGSWALRVCDGRQPTATPA